MPFRADNYGRQEYAPKKHTIIVERVSAGQREGDHPSAPKVRTGSFFPSLLERRRRIDRALFAVVMEAYVHGVSTRSVDDLVKALGADSGISKSEVSRICGELDEELTAFKERPLDHTVFPYIFLDATYCKARVNHRIASQAVVIATGGTPGRRLGEDLRHRTPRDPRADGRLQRVEAVLDVHRGSTSPERVPPCRRHGRVTVVHTSKRVTTRFRRIPGRGGSRPIRFFQAAVAVVVLVLGVPAGLVGCSASADASRPELDVPSVFYVSRDPGDNPESRFGIKERFGEQGSGRYTVVFDATDLRGVAVLKTGQDNCPVRLPTFRCGGELVDRRHGGSGQSFRVSPADGAEAGDSAVLRYRLTSPGLPSITASTRIVVGRPALTVETRADRDRVTPGGRVAVSLTLRNTGDVPARGVSLFIGTRDGLRMAGKHRNCLYRGTTSAWCRLPADDVVIPPGASYHLAAPEVFALADDATYPTVTFEAAGLGEDYVPPQEIASQYESGQGSALRYAPGAGQHDGKDAAAPHATGESAAHLRLAVRSTSDLVALADTARGPVGSRADVRVGVRNDGPGALPAEVKVEFAVPAGTTVVSAPYDPERDEEVIDQDCRALAADGSPLAEASVKQPSARRYVCTAQAGKAGATTTFPFTLRIDKQMAHRGGRVTVADGDSHRPSNDPKTANDSADVAVSVWPGPAWATPGFYATAGTALGASVLLAALAARRRRRSRTASGPGFMPLTRERRTDRP